MKGHHISSVVATGGHVDPSALESGERLVFPQALLWQHPVGQESWDTSREPGKGRIISLLTFCCHGWW